MKSEHVIDYGQYRQYSRYIQFEPLPIQARITTTNSAWDYNKVSSRIKDVAIQKIKQQPFFE